MPLYRTNGGLLDAGGLIVAEREVAPMSNPDEDTSLVKHRTIKPKGAVSERKFRRHCNCSDVGIPEKVLLLPPTQGNLIHS